jgi:predicted nucleic acid-binding protein
VILLDTSGVLAAIDPRQVHHAAAARVLVRPQRRILSPFVLAELDYLVATNGGQMAELTVLADVGRGAYELGALSAADVDDAIGVIKRYADLGLGLADASIVVLARRYNCLDVLTLDQRHFRVVLGPNDKPFRLFPHDAAENE